MVITVREACSYLPACCIPLQPFVASINQPNTLIVIEGYGVVVTSDRARWRGQDTCHKKLKREARGREVNEATGDHNTIGKVRKNVTLWRVRVTTAAMKT